MIINALATMPLIPTKHIDINYADFAKVEFKIGEIKSLISIHETNHKNI